jgi:hypothetical protein
MTPVSKKHFIALKSFTVSKSTTSGNNLILPETFV